MFVTHIHRLALSVAACGILGVAACADSSAPLGPDAGQVQLAQSKSDHFNLKFHFDPVTLPNGEEGEIYAGSKLNQNSMFTNCQYVSASENYSQFGSESFASSDPQEVEQFCLDHFDERS